MNDGHAGYIQDRWTPSRKLTEAIARVFEAREQAQGNVNPQLLAAVLSDDLAGV